jgi:hypothetical protein
MVQTSHESDNKIMFSHDVLNIQKIYLRARLMVVMSGNHIIRMLWIVATVLSVVAAFTCFTLCFGWNRSHRKGQLDMEIFIQLTLSSPYSHQVFFPKH